MEPTKKLLQKTNSTALSKALQANNTASAIEELSKLSIYKILDAREYYDEMSFQLGQLRKSYNWFKHTKGVEGRMKHMATLKKIGKELSDQLEATPKLYTLLELKKEQEDVTLKTLKLMLLSVVQYYQTSQLMTPAMIEEVALRIIHRFGGLTLEDVALCLHRVKNGDYGDVYNRVDGGAIMKWLQTYEDELQQIGIERNRRIHNQEKSGAKSGQEYRIVEPVRLKQLM